MATGLSQTVRVEKVARYGHPERPTGRKTGEGGAMVVTGWNNGSPNNTTGSGYGIRLSRRDRDKYFRREWPFVTIELEGGDTTEVNLAPSFWRRCTEVRGVAIGK